MAILPINKSAFPGRDTVIWRYVSLPKWLSILTNSNLFFTRLDQLGDEFEGFVPSGDKLAIHPGEKSLFGLDDATRSLEIYRELAWAWRYHLYVNCWTMAKSESVAMWRLYAPANDGVLIKSTIGKLCDMLEQHDHNYHAGAVRYLGEDDAIVVDDMMQLMFIKRDAFSYEQEFRFAFMALSTEDDGTTLCLDPSSIPTGREVDISLLEIVDSVRISPECPSWITDVIVSTTQKFAPQIEFDLSDLAVEPDWDIKSKIEVTIDRDHPALAGRPR